MLFIRHLLLFCLLSCGFAHASFADGVTPDDREWLLQTVTLPETRFFSGTIENKFDVFLRLAPKEGQNDKFVASYYVFSPIATTIEQVSLDGKLENGKLALEEFAGKPTFSLTGLSLQDSSRLKGTWFYKGKSRYVELRERKFEFPDASKLIFRKIEKNFPRSNYYAAMYYPLLSASSPNAVKFNRKIELLSAAAFNGVGEGTGAATLSLEDEDLGMEGETYAVGATEFRFAANSIVSGELFQRVYEGGRHPLHVHSPFTYDFNRGRDLELKEIFTPQTDYLKSLAFLCRPALHTSLARALGEDVNLEMLSDGSAPTPNNYGNWNVTPTGLLITFGDYQVAGYAQRQSRVLIPYSKIKHILKPEFYQRFTSS